MPRTGRPRVEKMIVQCTGCGCDLERYPKQVAESATGTWFCRNPCVPRKPRRHGDRMCEQCGKTFRPGRSDREGRYCSQVCHGLARQDRVDRECAWCGLVEQVPRSKAHVRHCSRACELATRRRKDGARKYTSDGYVLVWAPDHSEAQPSTGWAFEHRVVMADQLGRPLLPTEEVHHRYGIRDDNRPAALELWARSQPPGARVLDLLEWAREIEARYAGDEPALRELAAIAV